MTPADEIRAIQREIHELFRKHDCSNIIITSILTQTLLEAYINLDFKKEKVKQILNYQIDTCYEVLQEYNEKAGVCLNTLPTTPAEDKPASG